MKRAVAIAMLIAAAACDAQKPTPVDAPPGPGIPTQAAPTEAAKVDTAAAELTVTGAVENVDGKLTFGLTAAVKEPWLIKDTTPFAVVLHPADGVTPTKVKLGKEDFVDATSPAKTVKTTLEATPGDHAIKAEVDMYVCSAELCQREQRTVTTTFSVAAK